jgi:hypothetical protein
MAMHDAYSMREEKAKKQRKEMEEEKKLTRKKASEEQQDKRRNKKANISSINKGKEEAELMGKVAAAGVTVLVCAILMMFLAKLFA